MNRTRIIIVDGIEIHTSLSATEIADLEQKNKELINKIKFNEKSRRKMQQSLMKQINELEQQCKKQKEVIDKAKSLNHEISHIIHEDFLEENIIGSKFLYERIKKQLSILEDKEVLE
jgi:hypothetical protein